ncbi:ClpP family protease [Photobacterium damselae]|uniref:ClpP family protease n=1 Tax=Photobacterium damselae TaxID=38293 RepID=UPI001F3A304D|nr:ATP-dependent Clp protease proteolytic subunit [Photobacterium damselae]UKA04637.1 ATP-dependent Clp protease proteolytic subunit [Photobacterium damselae subsp. damselae]
MVYCKSRDGKKFVTPETRLFENRIVSFVKQFTDESCEELQMKLLCLDVGGKGKDQENISIYLNSGGGVVTAGLGLLNVIHSLDSKVDVVCVGQACSMGAVLLACTSGKRMAMKDSRIMIHQPLGGFNGQCSDIQLHAAEIQRLKEKLISMLADSTKGKVGFEEMEALCDRDNFLSASQALELGLIDEII